MQVPQFLHGFGLHWSGTTRLEDDVVVAVVAVTVANVEPPGGAK